MTNVQMVKLHLLEMDWINSAPLPMFFYSFIFSARTMFPEQQNLKGFCDYQLLTSSDFLWLLKKITCP